MNKTLYRGLILLSFLLLNAGILLGIGAIWRYMNTGADRSAILHDSGVPEEYYQDVTWEPSLSVPGGFGPGIREAIQLDYLKSWAARNQAFAMNAPERLRDFYTDQAYRKLSSLISENQQAGIYIEQVNFSHRLQAIYISADQTLAVIRDLQFLGHRRILSGDRVLSSVPVSMTLEYVLLLEDGTWRIRNLQAIGEGPSGTGQTHSRTGQKAGAPESIPGGGGASVSDSGQWADAIANIKGINYYPAHAPWAHFTEAYDTQVSDTDLARMQRLGINTARIFLSYQASGGAEVSERVLLRLQHFMDRAENRGIRVILTLFDFYGDYALSGWPATLSHLKAVAERLKDHPALLAWDLKNEPDLDFDSRSESMVKDWLITVAAHLRRLDGQHPVTIGWSSPEAASNLSNTVDFISFHYYGDPGDFTQRLGLGTAGLHKPVLLEEFGLSSYSGIWNGFSGSESKQEAHYRAMAEGIEAAGLPCMGWTLYDFKDIPPDVTGRLPWRRNPQGAFGILQADGTPKAAAEAFRDLLQK